MWAHPASAKEADFLFGGSGKAKGRGAKRRRGPEQPLQQGPPSVLRLLTHLHSIPM